MAALVGDKRLGGEHRGVMALDGRANAPSHDEGS